MRLTRLDFVDYSHVFTASHATSELFIFRKFYNISLLNFLLRCYVCHGNFEKSDDEDRITLSELPKGVLLEWLGITQFNAVKSSRKLIGLGVGLLNTLFESTNIIHIMGPSMSMHENV